MRGKAITLSDAEVQVTLDFIEKMRENKVKHHVVDKMFDKNNTSEGINIIGHLGEMAVGQYLHVPVDTEIRTGGDDGNDMHYNGTSVQVKTSELRSLIFNAAHLFKSDVAVLAQFIGKNKRESWKDPRFILWGWVTKDEFMQKHYTHDFGYGLRLVLDAQELHPIEDFVQQPVTVKGE